jgi:hypothetical protein
VQLVLFFKTGLGAEIRGLADILDIQKLKDMVRWNCLIKSNPAVLCNIFNHIRFKGLA